jgi:phosphatidylglycerophosphate synthase
MFDAQVRRLIDPPLDALARRLCKASINANMVTVGGFLIGMAGCATIAFEHYTWGLVLIGLNRMADGLDGAIARQSGSTDLGGFLDIILDMIFYSGVPFAFALAQPESSLPAMFLIYSFTGTGGSFLAYAVIAAKRGTTSDRLKRKSFFYSVGLMEGTETIVFFLLFCTWPEHFAVLAWTFGGLCWLTTIIRIVTAVLLFQDPPQGGAE